MINIHYNGGGFGNQMFQYCFARLLAEKNNIYLNAKFNYDHVLETTKPLHQIHSESPNKPHRVIGDDVYYRWRSRHGSQIPNLDPDWDYTVSGYFQDAELFNNNESLVRSFFALPVIPKNTTDTLVTLRLGDFLHDGYNSEIIHYQWYQEAMAEMPGKKDILACIFRAREVKSTPEQEEKYIGKLVKEDIGTITKTGSDLIADLKMRFSYDNIICSNSAFSWWGCFLGGAKNITTFYDFGHFGPTMHKCHGIHINQLRNIRNVSHAKKGSFLDISGL